VLIPVVFSAVVIAAITFVILHNEVAEAFSSRRRRMKASPRAEPAESGTA